MGKYANIEQVKVRVNGKVRFTDDPENEPNKMSIALLNILISDAESQVEVDLSDRYAAPFRTNDGQPFAKLPVTTQKQLKTLAELMAVIRVLETDFGSGSASDSSKYTASLQKRYDMMVKQLTGKKADSQRWALPPLPCLQGSAHNADGDTGYAGQVLSTSQGDGGFPAAQINDPSEGFNNGELDELDSGHNE